MKDRTTCPACGSAHLKEIYRLEQIPVQSCVLLDTQDEARAFPRAPLLLKACDACGFIFNAVFDATLVDYASITEESQHFSTTFDAFAERLITEIASHFNLKDRQTLEIGCGKGDFLQALARRTGTYGLGVDPGFRPERIKDASGDRLAFRREHFNPASIEMAPDLIVCRHTLEHIDDVRKFMSDVVEIIDGRAGVGVFFETPDAERVLRDGAFWDIYYEHCSYFTMGSQARLFRRGGLNVTGLHLDYHDQYIIQYAEPGRGIPLPQEDDLERIKALVCAFPERVVAQRACWADVVRRRTAAGKRVAIWGGGSKAVSFLASNEFMDEIAQVVDINPFKQGKYLPGSGHQVIGPAALGNDPPDTIIVMNPVYLAEVAAALAELRIEVELMAV